MKGDETQEIKQNHVESNPLYEIALDNIAEGIDRVINTLEVSGLHVGNLHVFRAHKQLTGLRNNLTKNKG